MEEWSKQTIKPETNHRSWKVELVIIVRFTSSFVDDATLIVLLLMLSTTLLIGGKQTDTNLSFMRALKRKFLLHIIDRKI